MGKTKEGNPMKIFHHLGSRMVSQQFSLSHINICADMDHNEHKEHCSHTFASLLTEFSTIGFSPKIKIGYNVIFLTPKKSLKPKRRLNVGITFNRFFPKCKEQWNKCRSSGKANLKGKENNVYPYVGNKGVRQNCGKFLAIPRTPNLKFEILLENFQTTEYLLLFYIIDKKITHLLFKRRVFFI